MNISQEIALSSISWLDQPLGSFHTHTTSKNINKHVWQYYSTSSLIARPVLDLLFGFIVKQTILLSNIGVFDGLQLWV